jgi:hypothetical protein
LALEESIIGSLPAPDLVGPVVEDEVSFARNDGEKGVALLLLIEDHREKQRGARKAKVLKVALLEEGIILTVSGIICIGPVFGFAVQFLIAQWRNPGVDEAVNPVGEPPTVFTHVKAG